MWLTSLSGTITPTSAAPLSATVFLTIPLWLQVKSCSYSWRSNISLNSFHHAVQAWSAQSVQAAGIKEMLAQSELTSQGYYVCLTLVLHKCVAVMICFCNICWMERGSTGSYERNSIQYRCVYIVWVGVSNPGDNCHVGRSWCMAYHFCSNREKYWRFWARISCGYNSKTTYVHGRWIFRNLKEGQWLIFDSGTFKQNAVVCLICCTVSPISVHFIW